METLLTFCLLIFLFGVLVYIAVNFWWVLALGLVLVLGKWGVTHPVGGVTLLAGVIVLGIALMRRSSGADGSTGNDYSSEPTLREDGELSDDSPDRYVDADTSMATEDVIQIRCDNDFPSFATCATCTHRVP